LVDLRENLSEKLARFRRTSLARDVYDLNGLGPSVRADLSLIRELVLLKVWGDVVLQKKGGDRKFVGGAEYCDVTADALEGKDDLGALSKPVTDWTRELKILCDTYGRATGEPSGEREVRLARCDGADKWWYEQEVKKFVTAHAA